MYVKAEQRARNSVAEYIAAAVAPSRGATSELGSVNRSRIRLSVSPSHERRCTHRRSRFRGED